MPYIESGHSSDRELLKPELDSVIALLTIYGNTSYYANLTKIALYRLGLSLYSLKKMGRLPFGNYGLFVFHNKDVSKEFVKRLIYHIDLLAKKIVQIDEDKEDYAGKFNYCCTTIIFEPLEPGIRYKKIPLINGACQSVVRRLVEFLDSDVNSHLDNMADSIIGVLALDIPLEFAHRYVFGYEKSKRFDNGDVSGYKKHIETLRKEYQN